MTYNLNKCRSDSLSHVIVHIPWLVLPLCHWVIPVCRINWSFLLAIQPITTSLEPVKNSFSRGLYAKFFSWLDSESLILFNLLFSVKVERVTKKMTEDKKEYDLKMQEYAQLLDIRADRIRVSTTILLTFQFVLWQMFLLLLADRTFTPWVSFSGSYFLFVWPLSVCVFVCLSLSVYQSACVAVVKYLPFCLSRSYCLPTSIRESI